MIRRAKRLHRGGSVAFVRAVASPRVADYSVASGIFNVKLRSSADRWEHFIRATLAGMRATSRRGFAVNFMASAAPGMAAPAELYRTSPETWAAHCEGELGCSVEGLQEYGMREFPRARLSDPGLRGLGQSCAVGPECGRPDCAPRPRG